jgi:dihydrofolate reductase
MAKDLDLLSQGGQVSGLCSRGPIYGAADGMLKVTSRIRLFDGDDYRPADTDHLVNRQGALMTRLRVASFSISIDGFGAGPDQDLANPLGVGGMALHQWVFGTHTFQKMHGSGVGETGIDDDFTARGFANIGSWILGRNMFGPVRGPWPDDNWKGWWGNNPPYHTPVFVLTNHPRPSITMDGGTVFHFVADGIHAALARATEAADGKDVRVGGGVATIRQYLEAALIDEMHLAISPVLLGSGEHLFAGINLPKLGYECMENVATAKATHVVLTKSA